MDARRRRVSWTSFLWRNLARNKLRSALTGSAIALAIALVCFLATMPDGLDRVLESVAANTRIVVHDRGGVAYDWLPYAYLQKIRAMHGVVGAASWTWFGGAYREEEGATFPTLAVEPDAVGVVWADWHIDPAVLADFAAQRDSAVVGRGTMQRYGWKPGDQVTLVSRDWELALTFTIVGEIPIQRAPHFYFQREYLEQAVVARGWHFDHAGMIWLRVDDPARVGPLLQEIDETFHNSEAETASETEKSFFRSQFSALEGIALLITIVTALLAVCIVFIAANTASMTVRERMREIAILKAIGFTRRQVFGMLIAESVLLATIAGGIGAGVSLGITHLARAASGGWNQQLGPLSFFIVSNAILVEGLFLAFFVGLISGVVPAFGAARRGVAQTLREVF
jgi:putative ABC transport system permease protein